MNRKGLILAGGAGTRLHPITLAISKQLLPIYDKPMVYYPLSVLMLAGIQDILLISTPQDTPRFSELLGDGSQWGINIQYATQSKPEGIAQTFVIGKSFINHNPSALILGDNIFYGNEISSILKKANQRDNGATIFAYQVNDPQRYGVVEFDNDQNPIKITEKPKNPKSKYAITGLYYYDQQVCDLVATIKPSSRGELEISDINQIYLAKNELAVEILGRGYAWLDTGTCESLLDAGSFIATIQNRQGLIVAAPEEIAYSNGWISAEDVLRIAKNLDKNDYGVYLQKLIENNS